MPQNRQSSIHLFRFSGIDVFLHWSWFVVAMFEINGRSGRYSSILWNVAEYLCLFLIVTLHEFGHALACRQVGGVANRIVLWPLGGVAFVDPPPRAGATLWSIAAGPLVNVALLPVLTFVGFLARSLGWPQALPDLYALLRAIWYINVGLLLFNLLPIYPLDGGQILRSLLWFALGRARSLMAATLIGFLGVAGFIVLAVYVKSLWFAALAVFMLMNCWGGLRHARMLIQLAKLPRRPGFACPNCKAEPPLGEKWKCANCHARFDIFATQATCPYCAALFPAVPCLGCGTSWPISDWTAPAAAHAHA